MLTRPFLDRWGRRLILAFGVREVTQRQFIEEIVLGCWLLIPLGIFLGFITIRFLAVRYNPLPRYIRSDIWTTCVIFIVGDILMELFLLPSLQCVPLPSTPSLSQAELLHHSSRNLQQSMLLPSYDISMLMWVLQFYHLEPIAFWASDESLFPCPLLDSQYYASIAEQGVDNDTTPNNIPEHLILFTPLATACLLSLRLIFICIGVHIGESLAFPICLTGGIACGKSTVGHQLVNLNETTGGGEQGSRNSSRQQYHSPPKSPSKKHRKVLKKPTNAAGNEHSASSSTGTSQTASNSIFDADDDEEREGTVYLICADSIAHEILLPPSVLRNNKRNGIDGDSRVRGNNSNDDDTKKYTVSPSDSVYNQLVDAFGEYDIFVGDDNHNGQDDRSHEQQSHDETDDEYDEYDDDNNRPTIDEPLIDRRKLGVIVFQDRNLRRRLNSITHPRILLVLLKRLLYGLFWSGNDFCCADLPLLFESGKLCWLFGWVICVSCPREMQLLRMKKRNPDWTEQECQARIDSQWPISKKEALSNSVIENSTTLQSLRQQVEEVRMDLMQRRYGLIGMSLMQMLLLIGGSTTIAVSSKWYTSSMSNNGIVE